MDNQKWLIRFKPEPDELLTSWLIRLINAHGALIHTFCRQLWPSLSIWTQDIDSTPPEIIVKRLATHTGISKNEIISCTLIDYENKFFKKLTISGSTTGVLSLGIYHRVRNRKAHQYCPLCLKNDDSPYFRKKWRLAFYTICPEHQVPLLDSCPTCGSNIVPRHLLWSQNGNLYCNNCRQEIIKENRQKKVTTHLVSLHNKFEEILLNGYTYYNQKIVNGADFLLGIRIFISALVRVNYKRKLLNLGLRITNNTILGYQEYFEKFPNFEVQSIETRYILIEIIAFFLDLPPNNLIKNFDENRISKSIFYNTEYEYYPGWITRVLNRLKY